MLEHRISSMELVEMKGSLAEKEFQVKQILKSKGFNLAKPISCYHSDVTGEVMYRQKRIQ